MLSSNTQGWMVGCQSRSYVIENFRVNLMWWKQSLHSTGSHAFSDASATMCFWCQ